MKSVKLLASILGLALAFAAGASAQDRATLLLRSGEKVSGQLVDLGGDGYTVVVNGVDRQVPPSDVSVIDFSGSDMTDGDWATFKDSPQIVLRTGESFEGSLYDITGGTPLHLTIQTRYGQRQLASNTVVRIVFSRPTVAVTTTAGRTPRTVQ
jgi:hypothetical protein